MSTSVVVIIVEIHELGCTVRIGDELFRDVLVPYSSLEPGQAFSAFMFSKEPLHLKRWKKIDSHPRN